MRLAPVEGHPEQPRRHRRAGRPRRRVRREPQGRVRDPRLRDAEGDRSDRIRVRLRAGRRPQPRLRGPGGAAPRHAGAQGGDRGGDRGAEDQGVQADRNGSGRRRGDHQRRRPVRPEHVLRRWAHRLRRGAVRPDHLRGGPRQGRRRGGCGSQRRRLRGSHGRVQRRRGVPADRAGHAGAARPAGCADRAARRVPHLRRDDDPARAGDRRRRDRVHAALPARGRDRHQHDHAAARVDDRPRCRHRLLALHRHAVPAVPARRAVAARRRSRGGRLGRPRGAVRRADGRDLRHRPRVLRARLHHEARNRVGARRPDDRHHRQLAADRRARKAGPQGRPVEGAVPEADRRLGGRAREDPDRALGPVRNGARPCGVHRDAARAARLGFDVGACPPRCLRPGHAAEGADGPPGLRPARRRASGPASTGRSRSSST